MESEGRLLQIRQRIDAIDGQLLTLLAERMKIAGEVADIKRESGIPILDEAREKQIVRRAAQLAGEGMRGEAMMFMRVIMAASRARQQEALRDGKAQQPAPVKEEGRGKMIIARFSVSDRSGALCEVLLPLMAYGVNISRMENAKSEDGGTLFTVEIECGDSAEDTAEALRRAALASGDFCIL